MRQRKYTPRQEVQTRKENREQVQREINLGKVEIDRSTFQKTEDERALLKRMKSLYKSN